MKLDLTRKQYVKAIDGFSGSCLFLCWSSLNFLSPCDGFKSIGKSKTPFQLRIEPGAILGPSASHIKFVSVCTHPPEVKCTVCNTPKFFMLFLLI